MSDDEFYQRVSTDPDERRSVVEVPRPEALRIPLAGFVPRAERRSNRPLWLARGGRKGRSAARRLARRERGGRPRIRFLGFRP